MFGSNSTCVRHQNMMWNIRTAGITLNIRNSPRIFVQSSRLERKLNVKKGDMLWLKKCGTSILKRTKRRSTNPHSASTTPFGTSFSLTGRGKPCFGPGLEPHSFKGIYIRKRFCMTSVFGKNHWMYLQTPPKNDHNFPSQSPAPRVSRKLSELPVWWVTCDHSLDGFQGKSAKLWKPWRPKMWPTKNHPQ